MCKPALTTPHHLYSTVHGAYLDQTHYYIPTRHRASHTSRWEWSWRGQPLLPTTRLDQLHHAFINALTNVPDELHTPPPEFDTVPRPEPIVTAVPSDEEVSEHSAEELLDPE